MLVPRQARAEVGFIYSQVWWGWLPVRQCTCSMVVRVLPVPGVGGEVVFVPRFTRMEAGLLLLCVSAATRHVPRHASGERWGVPVSRCTGWVVLLPGCAATLEILLYWCTGLEVKPVLGQTGIQVELVWSTSREMELF